MSRVGRVLSMPVENKALQAVGFRRLRQVNIRVNVGGGMMSYLKF